MGPLVLIPVILLVSVINAFISIIVYLRNPKSQVNRAFSAIAILFSLWSVFLLLYQYPMLGDSLSWIKTVYLTIVFLITIVFYFSFIFPRLAFRDTGLLAFVYALFYVFYSIYLLYFTDRWVVEVVVYGNGLIHTVLGRGYVWWVILTWGILLWSIVNFVLNSVKQSGIARAQLKYLMFGFLLWGIFVNLPDVIWPLLFNNTQYFVYSSISSLFFTISVSYIILRHRFLDIRLIIARSVTYLLLVIIMATLYTSGLFLIGTVIFQQDTSAMNVTTSTILAIIIAFTFQPLRQFLDHVTDRIFFRERYVTPALLSQLSRLMASTITLDDLIVMTFRVLGEKMHIPYTGVVLIKDGKRYYEKWINDPQIQRDAAEKLATYYSRIADRKVIVFEEMAESWEKDMMRQNGIGVMVPFRVNTAMVGAILLGDKSSGEIYTLQDIEVLEVLAPEMVVALRNALAYEEIRNFNVTLKDEVARATEELQKANGQLKELDHMKDEFVSVASHELRTPMTAIRSYLWLALQGKGGPLSEKLKTYLDRSYNSTVRLIKLVNDMLNISRIESGRMSFDMKNVDIIGLVEEVIDEIKPKADELKVSLILLPELKIGSLYKNIHTVYNINGREKEILDSLRQQMTEHAIGQAKNGKIGEAKEEHAAPFVIADADKIKEVMMNLIGNSLKFTPAGGKVTISFEIKDKYVITHVADNGIGVASSDIAKLFHKFGMIKGSYITNQTASQGTGLGLYISKQLLKLHDGDIWVESAGKGQGTTFSFSLLVYDWKKCRDMNENRKGVEGMGIIHSEI